MAQIAESLTEKIQSLNEEQLREVERFIEALQVWETDRSLTRFAMAMSAPALEKIWDNPEDDVYDTL
jgi:hypothetical protein